MRYVTAFATTLLLVVSLSCCQARADADPASDILLGENVFYPYHPPVASRLQARLNAIVAAAHRAHVPLKVALIGTPFDLGALPSFFDKPKPYAAFLDQEITFGNRKVPLLVVMPDGYGEAGLPTAAGAIAATLARPAASSDGLARAAIAAVPRIAAAAAPRLGRPLGRSSSGGGGAAVLLAIVAGVCVALAAGVIARRRHAARARPRRRRTPSRRR
jgi:hypothetical protein